MGCRADGTLDVAERIARAAVSAPGAIVVDIPRRLRRTLRAENDNDGRCHEKPLHDLVLLSKPQPGPGGSP
jgi:hypothetical protein